MTALRVIVDPMIPPAQATLAGYTRDLTRSLIRTAPHRCTVEGIVAAHPQEAIDEATKRIGGLTQVHRSHLARRELLGAWQLGIGTGVGTGLVHSPSLMAPLAKHDVDGGTQITVSVHDTLVWSHPKSFTPTTVAWQKAMLKRARKHADAVVVPTHAVAEQLEHISDFGDRIRVIPGSAPTTLRLPMNPDLRAAELGLPSEYVLTAGSLDPRTGVTDLITALGVPGAPDLPLLVVGAAEWGEVTVASATDEAGLAEGRVVALGQISDADLALVLSRASVFVCPSHREGFGTSLLDAFTFGTPVVHSDDAALVETAGGAGVVVEADGKGYAERLADAVAGVVSDTALRERLVVQSQDRARSFSWTDTAERIWTLHADL